MVNSETDAGASRCRGEVLEGIAFQFCKIATVTLIAGRYALPVAAALCAVFYALALRAGKKDTRCVLRYPALLIAIWSAVAIVSLLAITRPDVVHGIFVGMRDVH